MKSTRFSFFPALRRSLFALALALTNVPPAVAAYSQVVFFGDSLTDTGNLYASSGNTLPASPPYFNGRFSNGPLWSETLAGALGFSATPSLFGGNNYAWAGATVIDYGRQQPEIPQELGEYFSRTGGRANADTLYVILGGANDINDAGRNPGTAAGNIVQAAHAIDGMVDALYTAGARNILVGNLPDVGRTPQAIAAGSAVAAGASLLTQLFNSTLQNLLNETERHSANLDLDVLDLFALLNNAIANPAAFGFNNVTAPCKPGAIALPGPYCSTPETYLFWDVFHPSAQAHALIAANARNALPEPATLVLCMFALLAAWRLRGTPAHRR